MEVTASDAGTIQDQVSEKVSNVDKAVSESGTPVDTYTSKT